MLTIETRFPTRTVASNLATLATGRSRMPVAMAAMGFEAFRSGQKEITDMIMAERDVLCILPTGSGKCLAKDTLVIMYDGTYKLVQDIRPGDRLLGPDGLPRTVVSICKGQEEMFRITPKQCGEPYTVNRSHVLSLKLTPAGRSDSVEIDGKRYKGGDIVNISVDRYLAQNKTFKHRAKGWHCPAVTFGGEAKDAYLPPMLPPYLLGLWLGDGGLSKPSITKPDREIEEYLSNYAKSIGAKFGDTGKDGNPTWTITFPDDIRGRAGGGNKFINLLRAIGVYDFKHVPENYRLASYTQRLELLAGLLDTDGHLALNKDGSWRYYEFSSKSDILADNVVFVARSCGFSCSKSSKMIRLNGWKEPRLYWRVLVCGDIWRIPCKIKRKKAARRAKFTDFRNSGIRVDSLGTGDYYGFELEGPDKLFLLGDFTVTHNTACFVLPALANDWPTVIFSPLTALMRDQVQSLSRARIPAGELSGLKTDMENQMVMEQWAMGELKFLYAAPERMANPKFMELMRIRPPHLFVVDECFTPDVEILTEKGFIRFDKLEIGVPCAQFIPESRTIEFVEPLGYVKKLFDGELVRLYSRKLCDLDMTPGHELLSKRGDKLVKVKAEEFNPNQQNEFFVAGKHVGGLPDSLSALDRLRIAFQADGNLHNSYSDGENCSMSFTFTKRRKIDRFLWIMREGNFVFSTTEPDSRGRIRFIVQNVPGTSKLLTDNFSISEMSWQRAREFIEEMVCWDGSVINSRLYYYSSRIKENSDFIQAVAVLAGYKTNLVIQKDSRKASYFDMHRLFINKGKDTISTQCVSKSRVPYKGDVYCVRVPSGNIVVRRNGKVAVVGNCHCLSNWGDSFREYYKFLGDFVRDYNPRVVAAFSATIPEDAEDEIREVLGIKNAVRLEFFSRRSNLILSSEDYPGDDAFVSYVVNTSGPAIVYCTSIKRIGQYAELISKATEDTVAVYHGRDMDPSAKRMNMDMFMSGQARIIVATNAFGMGIDKANIRNIIHRDIPKSSEALTQEIGRAGRDGNPSWCKMFYSAQSLSTAKFFVQTENPTRADVMSVFRTLETLSMATSNILISAFELGQMCGLHDKAVGTVLTRLKAAKVIEKSDERPTIAGVDFVAGLPRVTTTFAETRDVIYANVLETKGETLLFDLNTVAVELGIPVDTLKSRLNRGQKDGFVRYYPPFRGTPMKIVGDIRQMDFEKLQAQAVIAETKLQHVLDYHSTPDNQKHEFLETIFGARK